MSSVNTLKQQMNRGLNQGTRTARTTTTTSTAAAATTTTTTITVTNKPIIVLETVWNKQSNDDTNDNDNVNGIVNDNANHSYILVTRTQ